MKKIIGLLTVLAFLVTISGVVLLRSTVDQRSWNQQSHLSLLDQKIIDCAKQEDLTG